jgi:hypothetical protein
MDPAAPARIVQRTAKPKGGSLSDRGARVDELPDRVEKFPVRRQKLPVRSKKFPVRQPSPLRPDPFWQFLCWPGAIPAPPSVRRGALLAMRLHSIQRALCLGGIDHAEPRHCEKRSDEAIQIIGGLAAAPGRHRSRLAAFEALVGESFDNLLSKIRNCVTLSPIADRKRAVALDRRRG